ncbi:MAG TPA: SH3 domain-containing protein [Rhabdochlamydiaceae bacterium]|nr:SH3 domain-containing protein [Rhabdochlamydiaceae bacterium]
MSRLSSYLSLVTTVFILSSVNADEAFTPQEIILAPKIESQPTQEATSHAQEKAEPKAPIQVLAPVVKKKPFSAFTGKVKGNKVRVRVQPDLDCQVIKELSKHDLVTVVDENADFWAIQPPEGIKAYVFRSFILDNTVEGTRVNVRLQPNLESPIIAHLNSGDKVKGIVSALNNKWLEIPTPAQTKFYVSKEFIEFAGGPELKAQLDKRRNTLEQLLDSASLLTKSELQKPFQEIDFERLKRSYTAIIQDSSDFPHFAERAKEALISLQENYLEKRIAYLENKAEANVESQSETQVASLASLPEEPSQEPTDRMKMWDPIEEALMKTWTVLNDEKNGEDFYNEQRLVAVPIKGILEAYLSPVKNKPGDYILKEKDIPVAYVYSTKIDLHPFVGKKVTLLGSPRSNNNFAFPAYFVHAVE